MIPRAHQEKYFRCSSSRAIIACGICLMAGAFAVALFSGHVLAQCPAPNPPVVPTDFIFAGPEGIEPSIAIDDEGKFAVVYTGPGMPPNPADNGILVQRYCPDASPWGSVFDLTSRNTEIISLYQHHSSPSVSMNRLGYVHVAWLGGCDECRLPPPCSVCCLFNNRRLLHVEFPWSVLPQTTSVPASGGDYTIDFRPSAGSGLASSTIAWINIPDSGFGCPNAGPGKITVFPSLSALRTCDQIDQDPPCFIDDWNPCTAQRSDGKFAVVWTDHEYPYPYFNIITRVFDENGIAITDEFWVNDPVSMPSPEVDPSTQNWAAVAFDDVGNLIVVWVGPQLANYQGHNPDIRIFARRLKYVEGIGVRDPIPSLGEGKAGTFIVDSSVYPFGPFPFLLPMTHPTVALTLDPENAGAFIVAWNANGAGGGLDIEGQYFTRFGYPQGTEVRLNADNGPLPGYTSGSRLMPRSAAHTLVYGKQGQVLATFRHGHYENSGPDDYLAFTYIPGSFRETLGCCKGDMDYDGLPQSDDIAPFINILLSPPGPLPGQSLAQYYALICPADTNNDGVVSYYDIDPFVTLLLEGICNRVGYPPPGNPGLYDCNQNGIQDATDIAAELLHDCNSNGFPDECEVGLLILPAADCNANGIPDECDIAACQNNPACADCNKNGIPDSCDIASGLCQDRAPRNGIPDICESGIINGPQGDGGD